MRASLVLNIIESYNKTKDEFIDAVRKLAQEESKKGNEDFAQKILNALSKKNKGGSVTKNNDYKPASSSFNFSSSIAQQGFLPKDKETSMNLMEIIDPTLTLDDLVLPERLHSNLNQIVQEWEKSDLLVNAGVAPTRRILFYGPPGCGKTVMGMALANALGKQVAYVRLDSLFSSYLGQTSTNLRKIFDAVSDGKLALFLDEFDSIGKKRDDNQEVGELKRIVITLLQNLDLLPPDVLIIAATNHQHLLDPAVWRRFDVAISVDYPSYDDRKNLINEMIKEYQAKLDIDMDFLIKLTEGMSISRLKDLMNQTIKSFLLADGNKKITVENFIESIFVIEKFDNSKDALYKWALDLKNKGISLRELEKITKIPKTTLSNHFKRLGGS